MKIIGIYAYHDWPCCEVLAKDFENAEHRNHKEIARDWFNNSRDSGKTYSGIMFIFRDDTSVIYTP